jgi:hypothetical protein
MILRELQCRRIGHVAHIRVLRTYRSTTEYYALHMLWRSEEAGVPSEARGDWGRAFYVVRSVLVDPPYFKTNSTKRQTPPKNTTPAPSGGPKILNISRALPFPLTLVPPTESHADMTLDFRHVLRLHPPPTLGLLVAHPVALPKGFTRFRGHVRGAHEEVSSSIIGGDKPVSCLGTEPLEHSLRHTLKPALLSRGGSIAIKDALVFFR